MVVSASLAAAGILVCGAAIIDVHFPKGSALGFAAGVVALAVAVALVLIGFVWACDKCEEYLNGHTDRLLGGEPKDSQVTASSEQRRGPGEAGRSQDAANRFPQTWPADNRYVVSLRDARSRAHRSVRPRAVWHGQ